LVDDLSQRGLLERTLVVWTGEFGRTPRIDRQYASRDRWPQANTVLFAGAGANRPEAEWRMAAPTQLRRRWLSSR
jgi:hypothetical protein